MKTINVLGTNYVIVEKDYTEEKYFKQREIYGYCDTVLKDENIRWMGGWTR